MGGRRVITEDDLKGFENMKDGVLIHDGKVMYANKAFLNMFGASSLEDIVGMDVIKFVAPEYRTLVRERIKLALEDGEELKPMVEKMKTLDGDRIFSEVVPIPAVYKGKNVVLVFIKSEMTKSAERILETVEMVVDQLSSLVLSPGDPYEKICKTVCDLLERMIPDTGFSLLEIHGSELITIFSNQKLDLEDLDFEGITKEREKYVVLKSKEGYLTLFESVVEVEGKVVGIAIFSKKGYGSFSPWDINSLKLIVRNIAAAMRISKMMKKLEEERERYRNLAMRDTLTGAYTRTFFREWIDKYQSYLTREGGTASLVVFDIDCLKRINDLFGHIEGDVVLKSFSSAVFDSIRDMDVFVRMGGDEFILILPETNPVDAERVVERIKSKLEGTKVKFSYGISKLSKDQTFQRAFQIADMKMYLLKGKRRCDF